MGYIPPNLDILSLSSSDMALFIGSPGSLEFLEDAFYIEHGRPYIKGTRTLSPVSESWCKYTALFDSRPEFDSLRLLFLVSADSSSEIKTFLNKLQSLFTDTWESLSPGQLESVICFLDKASEWANLETPIAEPPNFAHRVWPAYLECMRCLDYWFSPEEIIVVAAGVGRNVAIFKSFDAELEYYTGYYAGTGPITLIKLAANRTSRVSSHFERIIPTQQTAKLHEI